MVPARTGRQERVERRNDFIVLLFKSGMILVTSAEDVGHKVENLFFLQHHQQGLGHHRDLTWLDALHQLTIDIDSLIRITEIGVDGDIITTEIHDNPCKTRSVF